jgi:osmotically-inducible protein OsmY
MLRRIVVALGVLALLGFAPGVRAQESLLQLVQDSPGLRDIALSVHSRQALSMDAAFRDLNIVVQVKKGVAELRGQVPTEALSAKAVKLVEEVQGILGVRNYLEIRAVRREPGVLQLEPEPPSSARAASPNYQSYPEIPLSITPVPTETPKLPAPTRPPIATTPPAPAPPAVVLLTPVFTEEPPPQAQPPAPIPQVLVQRTRPLPTPASEGSLVTLLAEPAFKDIKVEQRGGAVYVHGKAGQGGTTMALARRLRDVPGVVEIILVPEGR